MSGMFRTLVARQIANMRTGSGVTNVEVRQMIARNPSRTYFEINEDEHQRREIKARGKCEAKRSTSPLVKTKRSTKA